MSMHDDYLDPDRAGLNDESPDNTHIEAAFADYDGPGRLYRSVYKYTDCGPSLGITILEWVTDVSDEPTYEMVGDDWVQTGTHPVGGGVQKARTLYCDDLYKLGTWADMAKRGQLITQFMVSSIVEGTDACTDTIGVPATLEDLESIAVGDEDASAVLTRMFWAAVEEVDKQAGDLWDDTHGCDTCAQHWADDSGVTLEVVQEQWDSIPVWKECPDCGGNGTVI